MTALATRTPGPLATPALAAHLTWKQLDVLAFLSTLDIEPGAPAPQHTTAEVSEFLSEIFAMDQHDGDVRYWGTSHASSYATLVRMEERGLVRRTRDGRHWRTTPKGEEVVRDF